MSYILLSLILIVAIIVGAIITDDLSEQAQRQIDAAMLTHSSY